jgi:hypothetical protein
MRKMKANIEFSRARTFFKFQILEVLTPMTRLLKTFANFSDLFISDFRLFLLLLQIVFSLRKIVENVSTFFIMISCKNDFVGVEIYLIFEGEREIRDNTWGGGNAIWVVEVEGSKQKDLRCSNVEGLAWRNWNLEQLNLVTGMLFSLLSFFVRCIRCDTTLKPDTFGCSTIKEQMPFVDTSSLLHLIRFNLPAIPSFS